MSSLLTPSLRMDLPILSRLISEQGLARVEFDSFSPAEWMLLLQSAQREGVGPLLYWNFSKSGKFSFLPRDVQNLLRSMYSSTWKQNQKIFNELETLSRLFHQADIPVVVLKGACFALTIYPDIGLRPMGDLDLLVPKARLPEAVQIAKTAGYEDAFPEAAPGLRDLLNHEICLQKTGEQSVTLELHHSLLADKSFKYAVPVDWFWSQTEPLAGSSQKRFENLFMLTPTAQVLYAASHAMLQHGGKTAPLRWFYDLDRLISLHSERLDWGLILSQSKMFEWGSALDAAFAQTSSYFNTPVPEYMHSSLAGQRDRHRSLVELLKKKPATHIMGEYQKLISLNIYGRLRLILALIAPSPSYMRWRYKIRTSWLLPIYYGIRWWDIFKDAVRTLVLLMARLRA